MEQTTKEQRFRQVLAEYAAAEVPASRDVWPTLQRRLRRERRPSPQLLNLTATPAAMQLRWSFIATAAIVILLAGMLSLVLPATLGQYSDHTFISPTKTFAATDTATAVVRTSTPLPSDYGYVAPAGPTVIFVAERMSRPTAPATPYFVAAPTPASPVR